MPIDFEFLEEKLDKKQFKYEDVKHKLVKVAWDIVQFKPSEEDIDGLWQIRKTQDGEIIVAMYDEPNLVAEGSHKTASIKSNWNVVKSASNDLNVFYKDSFITKIASTDIGLSTDEIQDFANSIRETLASDKTVARKMIAELSANDKVDLFSKHPELA